MAEIRHDFVVVIPVADRPRHLTVCLESLLELCRRYPYSGKVSVLIAEDSREPENMARHRTIAESFTRLGIETHYLSQEEQRALIEDLPHELHAQINGVIGGGTAFSHKGASITRNIAYLWLNRLQQDGRKRLFWFIDSDQEFRVDVEKENGEDPPYAIDYFHWLDRIFTETPARILTGKVVGDPPVSPAVMAVNFIDDVIAFLAEMATLAPKDACTFHSQPAKKMDDAAYHDMADLFGFKPATDAWRYDCTIHDAHDHAACFADFAGRLNRFFDGEHPTRRSLYRDEEIMASIKPARTLYTGNYVFTPEGLRWFIPFATLKLRMAGPTLGRIIKAELGGKFISANLPMLHKRTVDEMGQSEFRPGIERKNQRVDLSGEFERQYFGDVMLFSMELLTEQGFPGIPQDRDTIARVVDTVEADMHARYQTKQTQTAEKIKQLEAMFNTPNRWWHQDAQASEARDEFLRFIDDLRHNFTANSPAWQLIGSPGHRAQRKIEICEAISRYPDDRAAWRTALKDQQP